jgi:hypothetical protein
MRMNQFRTHCEPGSQVCLASDASRRGVVRRISKDGCRALVAWQGGDVTWTCYFVLELITTTQYGQE